MELSARTHRSADGVDLRIDPARADDLRLFDAVDAAAADGAAADDVDTVVVHVQLRPRRSSTRRCLAALAALGARHETVGFALSGLSGDDRVVRVTVGVELGPRELIAKFSDEAQAAYAFVDGLFTDLYDYMPVYVGEPGPAERAAAAGVLQAADVPRSHPAAPRIPSPRTPAAAGSAAAAVGRAVPVPV
jgi:hypothetical protein